MSILVFGATGQVACELQRQADVIALPRAVADLSDPQSCVDAIERHQPKAVINAAAYTAVDKAEEEEALATVINGDAPAAMARAAAALKVPFVHISTDYVFDGKGQTPWSPQDATAPLGAYGRSKLAGEIGVAQAGGQAAIMRTSWVFSAHGANFVKTMLRLGADRDRLTIVADQFGGPTPAAAIATAALSMAAQMQDDPTKGGTYHFSGAPDVNWAGFAREIFSQAGLSVDVVDIPASDFPTPAKRPENSRMDCSSLTIDFGIERPDWRVGLADVLGDLAKS
ncbi:MAG: dTDP-4-dehydrorhamnose reductase [Marinosulfonomonas sp.]